MIKDTSHQDVVSNRPPPKSKLRSKWVVVAIAVVAAFGIYTMADSTGGADMSISRDRLTLAQVTKGRFVKDIAASGKVVAAVSPTLYAPDSGTVTIYVKAGQSVEKNELLAQIESPDLVNELAQEKASLLSLDADVSRLKIEQKRTALENQQKVEILELELEAAEREMKRAEKSYEIQTISELDFQKAQDTLKRAKVDFRHSKQQAALSAEAVEFELRTRKLAKDRQALLVDDLNRKVDALKILSSVDGIVSAVNVEQKAKVQKNDELLTIVDLSELEVELQVPENYANELGLKMPVDIDFKNQQFKGEIVAISPEVNNNQVISRVRFTDQIPKSLRQNQRISARIKVEEKDNVLMVKRGAFLDSGGLAVYVVNDNLAKRRPVHLGLRSVSEVEVLSGLKPGETVVISNLNEFEGKDAVILR